MFQLDPIDNIPLQEVLDALSESVSGRWLQQVADCTLHYDSQAVRPYVYKPQGIATVPAHRSLGELMVHVVTALRMFTQPCINPLDYAPNDAILMNRVVHYDAGVFAIIVAYELMRSGKDTMWSWLYTNCPSGPIREYEKTAANFRTINSGEAYRKCWDMMFRNTTVIDKRIIHHMLFDEYMKASTKAKVSLREVQAFGELPNGVNYIPKIDLSKYSVLEDKSNANFLWFITFERSFQDKELAMLAEKKPECQIIPYRKQE